MEKKYIIGVLIIALIIIGSIFIINDQNGIKVENTKFKIPEGYRVVDADNYHNLTNGINSICIEKNVGNLDVNTTINNYIKSKQKANLSVEVLNFTVGNKIVYKVDLENSSGCHYWYEDNGKVYGFFTLNKSQNTDPLIVSLISSRSNSIF